MIVFRRDATLPVLGPRPMPRYFVLTLLGALAAAGCPGKAVPRPERPWYKPVDGFQHQSGDGPPLARGDQAADEPGPDNPRKVRVIYLIPSDRTRNEAYAIALERAIRHAQRWYRDQVGGKSFALPRPVVVVAETSHPAGYYSTHVGASGGDPSFHANLYEDAAGIVGAKYSDTENMWLIYIDADPACGQVTGALPSVATFGANDLRGLAGEPPKKICPTDSGEAQPVCRWVGGMAHMLGLVVGLSHPPGCADKLPTCDQSALMWLGLYDYPKTHLTDADKEKLRQSPFFTDWASTTPVGSCSPL